MFRGRMLIVVSSLRGGGAERVVSVLSSAWANRGCEVGVLTFAAPNSADYKLHPSVSRSWVEEASVGGMAAPSVTKLAGTIRQTVARFAPDVVISFIDVANILTLIATVGQRTPVVVAERTNPSKHFINSHWRLLRRLVYPSASALIVQTESVKQWATRFVSPKRVKVIRNPLRPIGVSPHTERRDGDPVRIIGVGRLSYEKGFDLLINAFSQVCRRQPNCLLELFGDGPERPNLERLRAKLNLDERVIFRGFVRDIEKHLPSADLFVLPSRYEGFPNALCEAMATGLPVISFDCDFGPGEIITDGQNGLLVAKEDPTALAGAIVRLVEDPDLREALGKGAQSIREKLSLEKILTCWDDVLPEVRRHDNVTCAE